MHSSVKGISVTETSTTQTRQLVEIQSLAGGFWPHLQSLTIRCVNRKLQCDATTLLIQAEWHLLSRLDLSNALLDAEAAMILAKGNFGQLRHLNLSHNPLGQCSSVEWLTMADWPLLESLHLHNTALNARALKQLARGKWPHLKSLVLSSNKLSNLAVAALSKACWTELRYLNLSHNWLTWQAAAVIVKLLLPRLVKLDLAHNLLSQKALDILSLGAWPRVQSLNLACCGMYALEGVHGRWPMLRFLGLNGNCLDEITILNLSIEWPHIECLHLDSTMLSTPAVQQLVLGSWPVLKQLYVHDNDLDDEALSLLSKACQQKLSQGANLLSVRLTTGPWPYLKCIYI